MPGMLLHHEKRLDVFMSGIFFAIGFSPLLRWRSPSSVYSHCLSTRY